TNPGTVRLNVVESSAPAAARFKKLRTVSGAFPGNISITIAPCSVWSDTHWPDIFSIEAPSYGSDLVCAVSVGRALAFFIVSALGAGFCAAAATAAIDKTNPQIARCTRCTIKSPRQILRDCRRMLLHVKSRSLRPENVP